MTSSKNFCIEVVAIASSIQNCLPPKIVHHMTLEQKCSEYKPTISKLKIFRSETYMHILDKLRIKLDNKSLKCILLGYDEHSKAYRLYHMSIKIAKKLRMSCLMKEFN
jgi:hypothetical protein